MRRAYLTLATLAVASPMHAQTVDGTVIIGGLIPLEFPSYAQAYSVDVIDEDDLEAAGDVPVADFLATRPGISISRAGPIGGTTTVRVRGLDDQYLTVRIDGIDVSDPSGPQIVYDFSRLTTSGLSRIEILKGSQSAAYGSEAVAGVVNIVTARADNDGPSARVAAEAGSHHTLRGEVGAGYRDETGEIAFALSRIETDGFSAAEEDDGNDEDDGFEQTRLSLSGAWRPTADVTLGFSGFVGESESEFDEFLFATGLYADGTPDERAEAEEWGARVYADVYAFGVDHTFAVTRYEIDRASFQNSPDPDRFSGERTGATYTGTAALGSSAVLAFGADWTEESFENAGVEADQASGGAFAEVLYRPAPTLELAFAVRYDDHSDFDDVVTWRAAAGWDVTDVLSLRAVAATGFRAPSLYERFEPTFGNPDLDPEYSRSLEVGADLALDRVTASATIFFTEIDDLIGFPVGNYAQIEGTSRTRGAEFEAEWQVADRVSLFGNYTYTETDDADGQRFLRVPRHDLVVGVDAALTERLSGRFAVRHVADQIDALFLPPTFVEERVDLGDYTVADVNVSYAIDDRSEAYVRVENLFDEEYQTVAGFGTSDRAIYAGFRASF